MCVVVWEESETINHHCVEVARLASSLCGIKLGKVINLRGYFMGTSWILEAVSNVN